MVSAQSLQYPQVEYPLDHLAETLGTGFSCIFYDPGIYHVSRAHNHGNNYHWGLTARHTIPPSRIRTPTTETIITKGTQSLFFLSSVISVSSVISIAISMLEL